MKKAIIIGATSGIGRALAVELSRRGYAVGLAGRREELLQELSSEMPGPSAVIKMDITHPEDAAPALDRLIAELGGMDILVISAGVGVTNPDLQWEPDQQTLAVNVMGFTAMAIAGFRYFSQQKSGHLVGISSIAGIRGSRFNPAYSASKAFVINYLEGLRGRAHHLGLPIYVTDIRPGFVETPMTHGQSDMFWVADVETAARQTADAIISRKRIAYITRRWGIIAWILRRIPEWIAEKY